MSYTASDFQNQDLWKVYDGIISGGGGGGGDASASNQVIQIGLETEDTEEAESVFKDSGFSVFKYNGNSVFKKTTGGKPVFEKANGDNLLDLIEEWTRPAGGLSIAGWLSQLNGAIKNTPGRGVFSTEVLITGTSASDLVANLNTFYGSSSNIIIVNKSIITDNSTYWMAFITWVNYSSI